MRRPQKDIQLTTYDDLLGISEIDDTGMDRVIEVPLAELFPFKNHPFHVLDDEKMDEIVESIRSYGVLNPALVRPRAREVMNWLLVTDGKEPVSWQAGILCL